MWVTLVFLATAGSFAAMTLVALFHLQWARRLPALAEAGGDEAAEGADDGPVRCSVIVAARDEELRIEDTVRHVLAQRGVRLEVVVVDDRSSDRTGEIVGRLAGEDARVRMLRVSELPSGW